MFPDPAIAALEQRLGTPAFQQRMRIEESLTALRGFAASPRTGMAKILLGSAALRLGFKLLGLQRSGYHQFLHPRVVDHAVAVRGLPPELEGVTILQLSDLHLDLDPHFVPALSRQLDGLTYDLAVITGDFRNRTIGPVGPAVAGTLELLAHLRPPVFAVLGNHDVLAMVPPLEAAGMRFLLNEHVVWRRGGAGLVVAGVDDPRYYATHDPDRAFAGAPADGVRVLLSHAPSVYPAAAAHGVHLMLAGHTHGGQICLPGGFMVLTSEKSPRRYLRGAWRDGETQGYTSPGTGACGAALRFHCPAEITRHILSRG